MDHENIGNVIEQAPPNSVEYKVYSGLGAALSNSDLGRRIDWLQTRTSNRSFSIEYRKTVISYLQAELVERRHS